jgi:hypothetical protein
VPEQALDRPKVGAAFEEVARETVTQSVDSDVFPKALVAGGSDADSPYRHVCEFEPGTRSVQSLYKRTGEPYRRPHSEITCFASALHPEQIVEALDRTP